MTGFVTGSDKDGNGQFPYHGRGNLCCCYNDDNNHYDDDNKHYNDDNNHYDDDNGENDKDGKSPHHDPGNLLLPNTHKCEHLGKCFSKEYF